MKGHNIVCEATDYSGYQKFKKGDGAYNAAEMKRRGNIENSNQIYSDIGIGEVTSRSQNVQGDHQRWKPMVSSLNSHLQDKINFKREGDNGNHHSQKANFLQSHIEMDGFQMDH